MRHGYRLKRSADILGALFGLAVFGIPMLVIAALVRKIHGSPVLFTQFRPGLGGRPFRMYKFRTMTNTHSPDGELLSDDERLTRFGRFLRSASLDELPEFINVIKGDMSLVGPRPLLMKYLPLYRPDQARRHEVRPGITGWAQVNGRNNVSWEDRLRMDVWYVDNTTPWLDLKILVMTVTKVIQRSGISEEGQATMSEFKGAREPIQR